MWDFAVIKWWDMNHIIWYSLLWFANADPGGNQTLQRLHFPAFSVSLNFISFSTWSFSGPVHLQIVFAYFRCLTSIVCQVLQVAPPERRPLPGQAQVYTGFHLKDRFPFCVWVIIILMRRNVVSQRLLCSTLFPCVVFIIVMMKNIVFFLGCDVNSFLGVTIIIVWWRWM